MTNSEGSLLDEVLPNYDVAAVYSIRISASAERIYDVLQRGIPSGAITKLLMTLRGLPRRFRGEPEHVPEDAFYRLKQLKDREVVVGIAGQFWKPVSTPLRIRSLEEFLEFQRDGYCKAAMNLRIHPLGPDRCKVTTETRVEGFGSAKQQFKRYWQVIGPFSGIIRREILRKIKKKAELSQM